MKNKNWKKVSSIIALLLVGVLSISGCGNASVSTEYSTEESVAYDMASTSSPEYAMTEAETAAAGGFVASQEVLGDTKTDGATDISNGSVVVNPADSTENSTGAQSDLQYRKLIRTVNMNVETEEFDALMESVENRIDSLGGYIENISTDSSYGSTTRYSNITVRIPSLNLDEFISNVEEEGNVTYNSESVQDVTLTYVDLESHKKVLLTEQDTLLRLLEKAETIEDIITIENRLSEIRYQIESMESQIRTYDNLIDYSTVYLYISEVTRITQIAEPDTLSKIKTGFVNSFYDIVDGLKDFAVNFVINLPYIILWAIVIGIALLIVLAIRKKNKVKKILLSSKVDVLKETKEVNEERSKE